MPHTVSVVSLYALLFFFLSAAIAETVLVAVEAPRNGRAARIAACNLLFLVTATVASLVSLWRLRESEARENNATTSLIFHTSLAAVFAANHAANVSVLRVDDATFLWAVADTGVAALLLICESGIAWYYNARCLPIASKTRSSLAKAFILVTLDLRLGGVIIESLETNCTVCAYCHDNDKSTVTIAVLLLTFLITGAACAVQLPQKPLCFARHARPVTAATCGLVAGALAALAALRSREWRLT